MFLDQNLFAANALLGRGQKNEQVDGTLTFLFILTLGKASDKKSVAACWSYCHAFIIKV